MKHFICKIFWRIYADIDYDEMVKYFQRVNRKDKKEDRK
jgi:hypothetical protein